MAIGTGLGWAAFRTIVVSVVLAFLFGYALTLRPLIGSGMSLRTALGLALASDTLSIAVMEIVDNAVMVAIPRAMTAGPTTFLFWGSMAVALGLAGIAGYPVNYWLIRRGAGHALVHAHPHHSRGE